MHTNVTNSFLNIANFHINVCTSTYAHIQIIACIFITKLDNFNCFDKCSIGRLSECSRAYAYCCL